MSLLKNSLFLLFTCFLFSSCFEPDEPVQPQPRLNKTAQLDAGFSKQELNYFSLDDNKLLATVNPMDWDISLEDSIFRINGFRSMAVAPFEGDWQETTDTIGLQFKYLTSDYDKEIWSILPNTSYVVDFGRDNDYNSLGYYKLSYQFDSDGLTVLFSRLEDASAKTNKLNQDEFHYSLLNEGYIDIPFFKDFDIAFGKYTDLINEQTNYLVYGCILGASRAKKLNTPFEDVTEEVKDTISLDPLDKTVIGWDWKWYDLDGGQYEVVDGVSYIIKSKQSFIYKLRFTDFYNNTGISGHPTFEFKLL